jgi:hypothetical protein
MVFHRILDFKTGLDFYPGPFFITCKRYHLKNLILFNSEVCPKKEDLLSRNHFCISIYNQDFKGATIHLENLHKQIELNL